MLAAEHRSMMFPARRLPEGPVATADVYGGNMAVRGGVFARGFRFNQDIGPNSLDAKYIMGGEMDFCMRVEKAGSPRPWFAPQPLVRHIVRPDLLTITGWAERAYRQGRCCAYARVASGETPPSPTLRQKLRRQGEQGLRWLRTFSPTPQQRFDHVAAYQWHRGIADEYARHRP
jgi:hypothetical protein